ncbi:MAG TPA: hypothetical protein PLA69_07355, partial [Flavobacterium sp.]|nr:hypothetical protein [Flavobacterium sp.]
MKKIFLFILGFLWLSSTGQTNTWINPNPGAWSNAAAWSLGVPTSGHDVVIPPDAIVTVASAAQAKTLTIAGGATLTLSNTLTLSEGGLWNTGAIVNWAGGSLTGSGNLLSSATVNLTTSSSKTINGGLVFQNSGTISFLDTGDLFMAHGTLTNLSGGTILLPTVGADITFTGANPHLVSNQGTIRATAAGSTTIGAKLLNQGTIQVESGSLIISHPNTQFEAGI